MVTGYSRWLSGQLIPTRGGAGPVRRLVAGHRAARRGAAHAGLGRRGRDRAVAGRQDRAHRRVPGVPRHARDEGDRAASRASRNTRASSNGPTTTWRRSFLPGRTFTSPADFNAQLQDWLTLVNARRRRALGCAPTERIAADKAAMLTLPPVAPATGWRASTRLARDHYVRVDSNDYSVHPAVIGRRIELIVDLHRVRALCDGRLVADHERAWAWHQTITDPDHVAAAKALRARAGRGAAAGGRGARSNNAAWPTTTPRSASTRRRGRVMATRTTTKPARDVAAEVAFLTRALKAPTLRESVDRLAERARAESWSHEEFLVACLQREVSARESHGGEGRIRAARFPARKSLEEFDFDHARGLKRDLIAHLGTLDFVTAKENVVFLGPPGTGKTHLAIGLAIRACQAGHRVLFATAADWVARLADAHHAGRLQAELVRLGRYPLLVIDEVGYIPFEPEAANLFFQLVSSRYERASLIVTSNKVFGRWGEVFGDDVVAAAMIDRLVHHAEVIALKGDSYRLKDRDLGRVPAASTTED